MPALLSTVFILYFSLSLVSLVQSDEYKLQQLQVLFRHCERFPIKAEIFLSHAYDFLPQKFEFGQMTKIGMQRQYKIGQMLRKRYDEFLGEYRNEDVYAYSTSLDHAKTSLQLMLAGLYPPTPSTSWNDSINWQPIPTHYEAWNSSFLSATFNCPAYDELYHKVPKVAEASAVIKKYEHFLNNVENKTDVKVTSNFVTWSVYNIFRALLSLNLPLPGNFTIEDFHEIANLTTGAFKALTYNEQLRRMMAGPIVEQFLNNFNDKESPKKVYLYSAHEFDIAAFIDSHNITGAPDIQDYGSTLVLEKLRGPDDRMYIRIYLWTGVSEQWMFLKIKNCEKTCPMIDYETIVQPILPNEATKMCYPSGVK